MHERDAPDLLCVGWKQPHGSGEVVVADDDIYRGPFRAFKESFHIDFTPFEGQLGPKYALLNEGPTPMATNEGGVEAVRLGREMVGDEREDIQRDAIDGDERVPPLADIRQRRRNISVELGNIVEGVAVGEISMLFGETL